jgi:shikimate dehydrogenase
VEPHAGPGIATGTAFAHVRAVESAEEALRGVGIVVNATPVGMGIGSDALPIDLGALPPGVVVLDLVYRQPATSLVREAAARGMRAGDGLVMLLEQGALSFERWFGFAPDRALMRRALDPMVHGSA